MKNFLLSISITTALAACNTGNKQDDTRDIQLLTDTSAYQNNYYSDTTATAASQSLEAAPEPKVETKVITRVKKVYVPVKSQPSYPVQEPTVATPPVATPVPASVPGTSTNTDNTVGDNTAGTGTSTEGTETAQVEKKKGWSNAAKGAAIGAGAGAIGGAILAKKKGLGAVVGGVVGAAGGYIIGKDIDKRKAGNQ